MPAPAVGVSAAVAASTFTITPTMILMGISIGTSLVYSQMQKKQMEDMLNKTKSSGTEVKANTRTNEEILPIVYGQARIGGNDVFIETSGNDNKWMWVVQNLCEGKCQGIHENNDGIKEVYLDDKLYTEYGDNVSFWFYKGKPNSVYNGQLHGQFDEWKENKHNTCYIIWRLTYDEDVFVTFPKRNIVLEGLKIYDLRDETTAYSNNPVLCLYDYLTNSRYGLGVDSALIDKTSWIAAANYCDTKDWHLNIVFNGENPAINIIDTILSHFRGEIVWWDDIIYIRYADLNYESSVMSIEDKHIVQDDDGIAQIQIGEPSRANKPDGLRVVWVDPKKDYETDSLLLGESDGNIQEIQLFGCTNRDHASHIGVYELERRQLDKIIRGVFRDDCLKLEPHDVITITSTALSISNQLLRVISSNILANGMIELTLLYESLRLYDDTYNLNPDTIYKCTLPDPSAKTPKVTNVRVTEVNYIERLRRRTRLLVEFDPPVNYPYYDHIEVWVNREDVWVSGTVYILDNYIRHGSIRYRCILAHTAAVANEPVTGGSWETYWVAVSYEMLFTSKEDFEIDPVEELKTYYIRLKTVTIWGVKTSNTVDYTITHTVGGYNVAPGDLSELHAVVNANVVLLYCEKVEDSDVELYEFRLGTAWSSGIFLAALRSPNLALPGCKPGTHNFWCNTLSNNGLYGENPVGASVTLPEPPYGWAAVAHTFPIENLVTNGTMDVDDNWDDFGAPTVNERSAAQAHQGVNSRKFTSAAAGDGIRIKNAAADLFTTVDNESYNVNLWVYPVTADRVHIKVRSGDDSGFIYDGEFGGMTPGEWNEVTFNFTEGAATGGVDGAYICIYDDAGDKGDWYVDDVCIIRGSFVNTCCYLYNGDPYIRCLNGILTGTYTTHIIDLGASAQYLAYIVNELVVTGIGTDWGSAIPDTTTWAELGADSRTWVDIFSFTAAPSVKMVLKHGNASPPASSVGMFEILSTIVTAQYYQVEITITDPSINLNALVGELEIKLCQ